ncbi:hypothetical protein CN381_29245 [Bacillus cereus]|nr:hypothetical protein CN381_29245 [Bacillus cereus]
MKIKKGIPSEIKDSPFSLLPIMMRYVNQPCIVYTTKKAQYIAPYKWYNMVKDLEYFEEGIGTNDY